MSGFHGRQNDAQCFMQLPEMAETGDLPFTDNLYLLADKIYPNRHPLLTPFTRPQINAGPAEQQEEMKLYNLAVSSKRVYIEHVIGHFKVFRSISSIFRHDRHTIAMHVELCVGLAQRRANVFSEYA
jgi:hypothetical protein